MLIFYFPSKQSTLGNNCVEPAARQPPAAAAFLQAARPAAQHLFPPCTRAALLGQRPRQSPARSAGSMLPRCSWECFRGTTQILRLAGANLRAWIWSAGESLTYASQTSGTATETPNSPSRVSQHFKVQCDGKLRYFLQFGSVFSQTQQHHPFCSLAKSRNADTSALRFSEKLTFYQSEIRKTVIPLQTQSNYTQQNWMYSLLTHCNPKHADQAYLLKCQA